MSNFNFTTFRRSSEFKQTNSDPVDEKYKEGIKVGDIFLNLSIFEDTIKVLEKEKHNTNLSASQIKLVNELFVSLSNIRNRWRELIKEVKLDKGEVQLKKLIKDHKYGFALLGVDGYNEYGFLDLIKEFNAIKQKCAEISYENTTTRQTVELGKAVGSIIALRNLFFELLETEEQFVENCQKVEPERLSQYVGKYMQNFPLAIYKKYEFYHNPEKVMQSYKDIRNTLKVTSETLLDQACYLEKAVEFLEERLSSEEFSQNLNKYFMLIVKSHDALSFSFQRIERDIDPRYDKMKGYLKTLQDDSISAPAQRLGRYVLLTKQINEFFNTEKANYTNMQLEPGKFEKTKKIMNDLDNTVASKIAAIGKSKKALIAESKGQNPPQKKKKLPPETSYRLDKISEKYLTLIEPARNELKRFIKNNYQRKNGIFSFFYQIDNAEKILECIDQIAEDLILDKMRIGASGHLGLSGALKTKFTNAELDLTFCFGKAANLAIKLVLDLYELEKTFKPSDYAYDIGIDERSEVKPRPVRSTLFFAGSTKLERGIDTKPKQSSAALDLADSMPIRDLRKSVR